MKRFYLALTNNCNRSCELCSMFSAPGKKTNMGWNFITNLLENTNDEYEVQLEGGEPLLYPKFYELIEYLNQDSKCIKIIITTNAVLINNAVEFLKIFKKPLLLKISVNEHLIKNDSKLFQKILELKKYSTFDLRLNIRLRRNETNDSFIKDLLVKYDLMEISDIYFYQRYGQAKDHFEYDEPFIIENPVDFYLYSPDGKNFGMDLIARSEHMRKLL